MKSVRNLFNALAFLLIGAGFVLIAVFLAKPLLNFVHIVFIIISFVIGAVYLGIFTAVILVKGRTNAGAIKYKSYQDMDLSKVKPKDGKDFTDEEIAEVKKKEYEQSSSVWLYMLFILLTPLLCAFHPKFQFFPVNAFSLIAFLSGLYLFFRQLGIVIERYGDAYTEPIPPKGNIGWFMLKVFACLSLDIYYIIVLLVTFGILNPTTFNAVLR